MANGLNVIALWINDKCSVVVGVIISPQAQRAVTATASAN